MTLLVDDRILSEYRAVLRRPKFGFDVGDVSDLLDHIEAESERLAAPPLGVELPDERDLPFLEVGVAGYAEALVTGNIRDFKLSGPAPIAIESPADFIRHWNERRRPRSE